MTTDVWQLSQELAESWTQKSIFRQGIHFLCDAKQTNKKKAENNVTAAYIYKLLHAVAAARCGNILWELWFKIWRACCHKCHDVVCLLFFLISTKSFRVERCFIFTIVANRIKVCEWDEEEAMKNMPTLY